MFLGSPSDSANQIKHLVAQEEYLAVLEKMKQLVTQGAQTVAKEDESYTLQQLQDLLGYEVVTEIDGIRMPSVVGTMEALPHLRRFPGDSLSEHDHYREAGLSQRRSAFGWFTELGQLTPEQITNEKYAVTVPFHLLPEWVKDANHLKQWLKFRKVIVVNPFVARAVVAVIGDVGPANVLKYQFGGSPEVIREGQIWHIQSRGRVWLAFINDPENTVPVGPIDLRALVQKRLEAEQPS